MAAVVNAGGGSVGVGSGVAFRVRRGVGLVGVRDTVGGLVRLGVVDWFGWRSSHACGGTRYAGSHSGPAELKSPRPVHRKVHLTRGLGGDAQLGASPWGQPLPNRTYMDCG